jgi:dTDP-4-amino-4,6-dideoxygalactose transaminase
MALERIPFVDVTAAVRPLRADLLAAIGDILDTGQYIGGQRVVAFEKAFAEMCGTPHAISVKNGTDALVLALRAAGVGPGDEVLTAPNSFFATAEAIALAGATPTFADVSDDTLLLDPEAAAQKITKKTKLVIPVHLYGQMADMHALRALGLPMIEDSCQAHGATQGEVRAGSAGLAGCFSFYPTKNLGAIGEGGAITTSSPDLHAAILRLRDHGQSAKHQHDVIGTNARLDAIQCVALGLKLQRLAAANNDRRSLATRYREQLADVPGIRFVDERPGNTGVYHLMIVRVKQRDRVRARLAERGIDTAIHYPTPIHLQPAFASLGGKRGDFPIAEASTDEILSLPMYPELAPTAVDRVCEELAATVRG